jgi:hypothetical protein
MAVSHIDLQLIDQKYAHTSILDSKTILAMIRSLDQFGQISPVSLAFQICAHGRLYKGNDPFVFGLSVLQVLFVVGCSSLQPEPNARAFQGRIVYKDFEGRFFGILREKGERLNPVKTCLDQ